MCASIKKHMMIRITINEYWRERKIENPKKKIIQNQEKNEKKKKRA